MIAAHQIPLARRAKKYAIAQGFMDRMSLAAAASRTSTDRFHCPAQPSNCFAFRHVRKYGPAHDWTIAWPAIFRLRHGVEVANRSDDSMQLAAVLNGCSRRPRLFDIISPLHKGNL